MTLAGFIYAGLAFAALGLAGLVACIVKAWRMKTSDDPDAKVRADLRTLAALNGASVGASFLGLGLLLAGLIL